MLHYWITLLGTLMFPMFFGIGQGPSKGEEGAASNTAGLASFTSGAGVGDVSQATNFWSSILSGDPAKIGAALGPEFANIQGQAQQNKDTTAAFSNRSGGTNAAIQATTNNVRAADTGLADSLITSAASNLGSIGTNLLGQGLAGDIAEFQQQDVIHGQHSAQINDLFNSITSLLGSAVGLKENGGGGGSTSAADIDATASGGYGPGNVAVSDQPITGYSLGLGDGEY